MKVIGTLLMVMIYLVEIFVIGAIPMVVVASIIALLVSLIGEADIWDKYGIYYFMLSCPVIIAILYAILLSYFDGLLICVLKCSGALPRCRKPSKDEKKHLDKSGASDVLVKSGVKIENVLICDDDNINAYAVGSETVIFTVGIFNKERISEDMLCGIAAREARRIFKGDTKIPRVFYAFSGILFVMDCWAVKRINRYKPRVESSIFSKAWDWSMYKMWLTILRVIRLFFKLLLRISNLIMIYVYLDMERDADEYVHKEYGDGLKKFLHVFLKAENEKKALLMKRLSKIFRVQRNLLDTYTPTKTRIEALEELEKLDAEKI